MGDGTHAAHARVKMWVLPMGLEQGIVAAVVGADPLAQPAVRPGGTGLKFINPGRFIRRDALGSELSADPIGFLCKDNCAAQTERSQSCCHAAQAGAHDQDISLRFLQEHADLR